MSGVAQESELQRGIRELAWTASHRRANTVCAGLAVLLLVPAGAHALSLGPVTVRSALGQPLKASIPVTLSPGEALSDACVSAVPPTAGAGASLLPRIVPPVSSQPGVHRLSLSTDRPLLEPMYEIAVQVNCPGIPVVVRQYVLMLDLPGMAALPVPVATAGPDGTFFAGTVAAASAGGNAGAPPPATPPPARPRATPSARTPATPLRPGERYTVRRGDTLSSIAARVQDRPGSLWQMAELIHAGNPDAFIRNDPDLIREGSEIHLPAVGATTAPATVADTTSRPMASVPPARPAVRDDPVARENMAPRGVSVATAAADTAAVTSGVPEVKARATPAGAGATGPATMAPATSRPDGVAGRPAADVPTPAIAAAGAASRAATGSPATAETAPVAASPSEPVSESGAGPWIAAVAGGLFGLLLSSLIWFGRRIAPAERRRRPVLREDDLPRPVSAAATIKMMAPSKRDEAITVSFTPAEQVPDDDFGPKPDESGSRTGSTGTNEITAELAALFEGDQATAELPAAAPTASRVHAERASDPQALPEAAVAGSDAGSTSSGELPPVETGSFMATGDTLDLPALAASAEQDPDQADSLMAALSLLERDYQDEYTASQVFNLEEVRDALQGEGYEDDDQEATRVRRRSG